MQNPDRVRTKMQMRFCLLVMAVVSLSCEADGQSLEENSKTSIKEVMRITMTKGLAKKVIKGEASQEEKDELVQQFVSMSKLPPPKGNQKSWDSYNAELIRLSKEVASGKQSNDALAKAVNCVGCHRDHRPK